MASEPVILGIQYGGHDTAAALMRGGRIVAACEQERFSREKHSRRFPLDAIRECLAIGGVSIRQVDEIAFGFDPQLLIRELYLKPALADDERLAFLVRDIDRIKDWYGMDDKVRQLTGYEGPVRFYRHHLCHLASAYYPSGFDEALAISLDGIGECETGIMGVGRGGRLDVVFDGNRYPDSLGLLYSAITFYLGWKHHCDEGIVMGLAPYGDPTARVPGSNRRYDEVFAEIVQQPTPYTHAIDREWIAYHRKRDTWISEKFTALFGPRRQPGDELTRHHENIAAALQKRLEEVVLNMLRAARSELGLGRLCLAGGVALNCSMNGKIAASGLFDEIHVAPASGDGGIPIGACFLASRRNGFEPRPIRDHNVFVGSRYGDAAIREAIDGAGLPATRPADVAGLAAEHLVAGKVVGWFQGAAEVGPRALGGRSILCRPFPAEMKDHLNLHVKRREGFRPYAPAVLAERASEFFEIGQESPHMLIAAQVRPQKRHLIPAVVHVDGTARVQTVGPAPSRLRGLLEAFDRLTGIPVVLNTSFNVKGQPMVNSPREAIDCFSSTRIDCLVLGDYFIEK